jgi:thioredoxin-like negative regulator of GroEL
LGSVLASIDALPDAMTGHKSALKIQMLHRAGLLPQAVELIRAESVQDPGPESRVKLALTAAEARANELASELLAPAIKELTAQNGLRPR